MNETTRQEDRRNRWLALGAGVSLVVIISAAIIPIDARTHLSATPTSLPSHEQLAKNRPMHDEKK